MCIPLTKLCNGANDCIDNTDEKYCSCKKHEFECDNGQCIEKGWLCDGNDDCGDRSDEQHCESK